MASVSALLAWLTAAVVQYRPEDVDPSLRVADTPLDQLEPSYDFIIVGAGSAGSVVANRLSQEDWTVLLLEAGGEETPETDTPHLAPFLERTSVDWNYTTVRQQYACQMTDGVCRYTRGHVIGGSSTLNYMAYVRGHRKNYEDWVEMGAEGWGWDQVLPYFKKSQDMQVRSLRDSKLHGRGGYLTVKNAEHKSELRDVCAKAVKSLGYKMVDYNNGDQAGYSVPQFTERGPSRCSTGKAFLRPARDRKNLVVVKHSLVTRVLIEDDVAMGIEFIKDGELLTVMAKKEVILSAGAVNTPKLLMLSGIGPKDHLEELGIPVIKDLPVGLHMQDHLLMMQPFPLVKSELDFSLDNLMNNETIRQYAEDGKGPLTIPSGIELLAFGHSLGKRLPPDMILFLNTATYDDSSAFVLGGGPIRPRSRGWVKLSSADPLAPPLVNPNYLSDDEDRRTAYAICKTVLQISRTQAFSSYRPRPGGACSGSDAEVCQCMVEKTSGTFFHPCCTARMGRCEASSVVDPQLRVHGIYRLRVVDASVMPGITSGPTNAPTIMIGEKASDMIKTARKPSTRSARTADSSDEF